MKTDHSQKNIRIHPSTSVALFFDHRGRPDLRCHLSESRRRSHLISTRRHLDTRQLSRTAVAAHRHRSDRQQSRIVRRHCFALRACRRAARVSF